MKKVLVLTFLKDLRDSSNLERIAFFGSESPCGGTVSRSSAKYFPPRVIDKHHHISSEMIYNFSRVHYEEFNPTGWQWFQRVSNSQESSSDPCS